MFGLVESTAIMYSTAVIIIAMIAIAFAGFLIYAIIRKIRDNDNVPLKVALVLITIFAVVVSLYLGSAIIALVVIACFGLYLICLNAAKKADSQKNKPL